MKKHILALTALACAILISGCASTYPVGTIVTELQMPVAVTSNDVGTKVGKSQAKSYLGLVAIGDASIETAKKNGGITKVTSIDWKVKNLLGIIGEYECVVRGE